MDFYRSELEKDRKQIQTVGCLQNDFILRRQNKSGALRKCNQPHWVQALNLNY
jgi:hypothetical protein